MASGKATLFSVIREQEEHMLLLVALVPVLAGRLMAADENRRLSAEVATAEILLGRKAWEMFQQFEAEAKVAGSLDRWWLAQAVLRPWLHDCIGSRVDTTAPCSSAPTLAGHQFFLAPQFDAAIQDVRTRTKYASDEVATLLAASHLLYKDG